MLLGNEEYFEGSKTRMWQGRANTTVLKSQKDDFKRLRFLCVYRLKKNSRNKKGFFLMSLAL